MNKLINDVNYCNVKNVIINFSDNTTLKLNSQNFIKPNFDKQNNVLGSINYNDYVVELRNTGLYINYNQDYNIFYNYVNNTISVMYKNVEYLNYNINKDKMIYVDSEYKTNIIKEYELEYENNIYINTNGYFECYTNKNFNNLHSNKILTNDNNVKYYRIFYCKNNTFVIDDLYIDISLINKYVIYVYKIFNNLVTKNKCYPGVSILHTHYFQNTKYENLFNNHNNNLIFQNKYLIEKDLINIIQSVSIFNKSLNNINPFNKKFYSHNNDTNTVKVSMVLYTMDVEQNNENIKHYLNINVEKTDKIATENIPHYINENNNTIFIKILNNGNVLHHFNKNNMITYANLSKHEEYVNFDKVGDFELINLKPIQFLDNYTKQLLKNTENNDEKLLSYIEFLEQRYQKAKTALSKYGIVSIKI